MQGHIISISNPITVLWQGYNPWADLEEGSGESGPPLPYKIQISLNYIIKLQKICIGPPPSWQTQINTSLFPPEKFSGFVHVI